MVGLSGAELSLVIITAVDQEDSLPAASVAVAVKVYEFCSGTGTLIENNPSVSTIPLP